MADEQNSALTGAAFELVSAGFRPMPDEKKEDGAETIGSDSESLREAAGRRAPPLDEIAVRKYTGADGEPAGADEAITLDRAVRDYARATALDRSAVENESGKALAARVDALRAAALANDPDAAEFYGFEPPVVEAGKSAAADSAEADNAERSPETAGDRWDTRLDPDLERALQHPQVVHAIEEKIAEAEQVRQSYVDGLVAATRIAQASFLSQFPEVAGIAPEYLPGALELMSRQDPAKFARIRATIESTEQLLAQHSQESSRQAELARQNFRNLAQREDARLDGMLKGESKATQQAVSAEIVASAKASGVEPAELFRLFETEPLMRNATFQRMMYDAGKYRLMMKARDVATARPLPPVQRPGTAASPAERAQADIRTLSSRLSSSGDIKDAVALYNARKSGRR